jgi:predicted metal-dependent hydrolase
MRARKYILRVRPDGSLRVTIPRGGSRAGALRFVETHLQWIDRERARLEAAHAPRCWTSGSIIPLRGELVALTVVGGVASYGDRTVRVPQGTDDLRPLIESDLRALARETLIPRLHELAAQHGLTIGRVTIRNQRSRWGSCSGAGRIALNFRLVQMPPAVCDYVLIHELMHIPQPNHGSRFWRLVAGACPEFRAAERWLKVEGRGLF